VARPARKPDDAPRDARTAQRAAGLSGRADVAPYTGRFAPSPTGPLHAGSLVAALASWLDARAHGGTWLVRIEDTDTPRCVPGAAETILAQLAACGLVPDATPLWQSKRGAVYESALQRLIDAGHAFPCGCSRKDIEAHWAARGVAVARHADAVYPGTCRDGLHGKAARAWRLRCGTAAAPRVVDWFDRRLGPQTQDVTRSVGDFVLRRADGLWAYQLAVVVDDADQGVTHVVRGEDLTDNTPRQIHLQRLLGLPPPIYLHTPLVLAADGQKLSKQTGAAALPTNDALASLQHALQALGLAGGVGAARTVPDLLAQALAAWRARWCQALAN
jgi:glutamyl-Q tRNA(Asp) synthetase